MSGRRRLVGLGVVLAVAGLLAPGVRAQAPRLLNIGALTSAWGATPSVIGLRDGLQALGYRENEQFVIGVRFTRGDLTDMRQAARDLVRGGADVIFAEGGHAARAAQLATVRLPIVFLVSDPLEFGLVESFARPGGNSTGIADRTIELAPKRLEIFKELVPGLRRVVLPYDADDAFSVAFLETYREAARRLELTLVERPVRSEAEAEAALADLGPRQVVGLLSPRFHSLNIPGFILAAASRQSLPTMLHAAFWVEQGGLASYGASPYQGGRQAARLLDRIVKGARPGDLPVEQPTTFELVLNRKTARALGLAIPPSVLLRASRVIE